MAAVGVTRVDASTFEVDGTTFVANWKRGVSTPEQFAIMKSEALIERYIEVVSSFPGTNIVELGIREGGSTALLALISRPRKLVAFELAKGAPALEGFIERNGLTDSVHPWFGVDQADRGRLAEILDKEFNDEPIDLVIDDASHFLEPTRASFEVLFPRLRPGGLFVIEDWAWQHEFALPFEQALQDPSSESGAALRAEFSKEIRDPDSRLGRAFVRELEERLSDPNSPETEILRQRLEEEASDPDSPVAQEIRRRLAAGDDQRSGRAEGSSVELAVEERALTALVMELTLAQACSPDAVEEIVIGRHWVTVRRGDAALDSSSFRVADLYRDHFGLLPRDSRATP